MNSVSVLVPSRRSSDAGTISIPNFLDPSQWGAGMYVFVGLAAFLAYRYAHGKRWV